MKMIITGFVAGIALFGMANSSSAAGPLKDRIASGQPIRIGYSNEVPSAYTAEDGKPTGWVNDITLAVLKKMGYAKIEPVETEWGGLIPGLNAGRFDIITGGMFILASRCSNVAFSEPIYRMGDAFLVPVGNPKRLLNYENIRDAGAIMVTGAGYANIANAKASGVDATKIMEVPGPTEILAAMQAERADVGAGTPVMVKKLADSSGGKLEATNSAAMPKNTFNWGALAFTKADQDFVDEFNKALKEYVGSEEMLTAVAKYGYNKDWLPGDAKTEWICANR
ncbi:Ectoine/hydroxyectoine ABC transporter solute-binding protein [Mesorhizobium sp. ORS 3359]|uniref:ectoine/hydroxyectoine ABC transporter substrate-binding protein EhuB n=1 Tax=Mesorhizobium sp. LCM 4576 TaxID=1848289 RepID=UPI000503451C|nr:ectoine/hydroxyectoine ABC transporter substrate-binding protein EhuB [Mesorhizobium sp. LCM 4576]OHV69722.1 ectoine/hydroxyectoine ABC transporter substrate-binding protein EhuB [Mesorhizobium sp. LCM 4576]CDX45089.1 Ectoine/hydroxyectoine ABC transporter solute-binding protein [Mesorhizobium sp. ORS 3359]